MRDVLWYSVGIVLTALHRRLVVGRPWKAEAIPTLRWEWYLGLLLVAILWPISLIAWAIGPLVRQPVQRWFRRVLEEDDHGQ